MWNLLGWLYLGLFSLTPAWAVGSYKPNWMMNVATGKDLGPNQSFLNDTSVSSPFVNEFGSHWIEPNFAKQVQQAYQDRFRNYEMQETYHLVDLTEQRAHAERLMDFGKSVLQEVKKYHVNQELSKLRAAVDKDSNLQSLKKPALLAAAVLGVYYGQRVNFEIKNEYKFSTRTDVPSRRGAVSINSPLLNCAFDFSMGNKPQQPLTDPFNLVTLPGGSLANEDSVERYRLSVSRDLPFWGISSGMSYGRTSNTVYASLRKELLPSLACSVDTTQRVTVHYEKRF